MKATVLAPFFAFALLITPGPARADSADVFKGVTSAKVVWDVTQGDERRFNSQVDLIGKTADSLRKRGIAPDFVVTIRGPATKFVTKTLDKTNFEKDKDNIKNMAGVQETIRKLKEGGVPVAVCAEAMKVQKVESENIQPFVLIADNVWENLIVLQNKGYAYIQVD